MALSGIFMPVSVLPFSVLRLTLSGIKSVYMPLSVIIPLSVLTGVYIGWEKGYRYCVRGTNTKIG